MTNNLKAERTLTAEIKITARHANFKEEATHRFMTHIRWGRGYFGDHYRYLVASSDEDAFKFAEDNGVVTDPSELQRLV